MRTLMVRHARSSLALAGAALAGALLTSAAQAQGVEDPVARPPVAAWRISVSGGVMTEPMATDGRGAALLVDVARRLTRQVRLVALGITSQVSDEGLLASGRYEFERDWRIAAIGVETPFLRTPRVGVLLGVQAGAKWSRMSRFSWIGTPPPGEPQTTSTREWDEGAILVPSLHLAYRVTGPLSASARLASVTHIFTDDMIGNSGVLFTVGANLAW
jgi:hypothetical protein